MNSYENDIYCDCQLAAKKIKAVSHPRANTKLRFSPPRRFFLIFFLDEMLNKKLFYVVIVAVINLFHRGKGDIKVCNARHFFLRKSARFGHV